MLQGVYIFRDDDFQYPIYADPDGGDLDPDVWEALATAVSEALEGEARAEGHVQLDEVVVGCKPDRDGVEDVVVDVLPPWEE